jgi:hypothetical protein
MSSIGNLTFSENEFGSQYSGKRFTTAYISFQPTETCA